MTKTQEDDPLRNNPHLDVMRSHTAQGLAKFYDGLWRERGIFMPPHLDPICRALADQRIRRLMIVIGPGAGKSLLLSVTYPCWLLGIEPNQTILGVSGGESLVQGFMHACMEVIEWSRFYHAVFPETRPDRTAGWSTERGLFVTGRLPGDPDASYWGAGLTSATLTGKHGRTLIFDDLHNADNSATAAQCEKVVGRYYDTLIGRADPQGARFIIAGRRFSENDIYGHLKDSGDWVVLELPAEREGTNELYYDLTLPDGLKCCFNEAA